MAKRRIGQRCTANDRKGQRCGRYCAEGQVVCAQHDPARKAVGVIAQQDSDDPVVIVRRLMKDRDPRVRLQAVGLFSKLVDKEKGCETCAERNVRDNANLEAARRVTPEQEARLRELFAEIRLIKVQALLQPVKASTLAYEESINADIDQHPEPTGTTGAVSATADQHAARSASEADLSEVDDGIDVERDDESE